MSRAEYTLLPNEKDPILLPTKELKCIPTSTQRRTEYWRFVRMNGLVVNGGRTQTTAKENDDPEAFPFQTTQTRLNRWINTQDSANSVFSTRSLYVFSNRNNGSARRSAARVGKTEEARVFRENFYGGKKKKMWFKFFNAWIKKTIKIQKKPRAR